MFGLLKAQFGVLWQPLCFSLHNSIAIIRSCFALHNLIADNGQTKLEILELISEDRHTEVQSSGIWKDVEYSDGTVVACDEVEVQASVLSPPAAAPNPFPHCKHGLKYDICSFLQKHLAVLQMRRPSCKK